MDSKCFIPSLPKSKLADSFDLASKCFIPSLPKSNAAVADYMKTKAITGHWFREEVEGSDQSGGQCGYGDNRAEEEKDGDDDARF
ncbi:hypothetical protein AHAS_Ahas13G0452900 [Arachis hypogaea]